MISGAARGTGGRALGAHLADARALNEETRLGASRGLVGETIREQVAELTELASHSRARRPVYHAHVNPEGAWNAAAWDRYWTLFEREFGLERHAFSEAIHEKGGREHRHRVYSLVRPDGTTEPMRHDYARREKLSRILEVETGARLVPGAFNRTVAEFLRAEGREDVAAAMQAAGALAGPRPRAAMTPRERAQAERTGVDPRAIGAAALAAWRGSDSGRAFAAALMERGLRLAMGDKVPVIVDQAGGTHPLRALLAKTAKNEGDQIRQSDVAARLDGLDLPRHDAPAGRRPRGEAAEHRQPPGAPPPAADLAREEQGHERSAPPAQPAPVVAVDMPLPPAVPVSAETAPAAGVDERPVGPAGSSPDPALPKAAPTRAGAPAAAASGADDLIEPLDPTKPGDAARFLRQWAQRMQKQAAAATGGHHAQQHTDARELLRAVLGAFTNAYGEDLARRYERHAAFVASELRQRLESGAFPDVDGRPGEGDPRRDGRPEPDKGSRPEGTQRRDLRRPEGGGPGGQPRPPTPTPGPTGPGGDNPARQGRDAPGGHRRESGTARAQAGAARIRARREEQHLAGAVATRAARLDALTAWLREEPTPRRLAAASLRADREATARVLAGAPWPDPGTRDAKALADEFRTAERRRLAATRRAAEEAARAADEARRGVRLTDRLLPWETCARRAAREARERAEAAKLRLEVAESTHADDIGAAADRAQDEAATRRRVQHEWEQRPDVLQARERERLNSRVAAAIEAGDPLVLDLAASGDLAAARAEISRREEEAQREQERRHEEQLRHAQDAARRLGIAEVPRPRPGR